MERLADAYGHQKEESQENNSLLTPDSITFDFFAVAAIAVVLILISKTTPGFQEQLVLNYDNPSLHAFYTTHFVHESIAHLRGNFTNYLIVVPLTYPVCLRAGRRREFRLGFLAILFILPPILSLVSYVSLDLVIETITLSSRSGWNRVGIIWRTSRRTSNHVQITRW